MNQKKIFACLDIKNGRTVKGVKFKNLRDAGDPGELAKRYMNEGVDELVFLDISATEEKRQTQLEWIRKVAKEITIPFTVGGGIKSVDDAQLVFEAGADMISINSAAVSRPKLIDELVKKFGSEKIILAIDAVEIKKEWRVACNGGNTITQHSTIEWAKKGEKLGAGKILLTSLDHDGMKNGFALGLTNAVAKAVNIPVVASGGAGKIEDFADVFQKTKATAALGAGVFHFGKVNIKQLKEFLNK